MSLEQYNLNADEAFMSFEFISKGPKGEIVKLIQYTELGRGNIFNLGFGDKDELTGSINDIVVTDNKDREKVLATVVASIHIFTNYYPLAWIYLEGSTESRTRLYRMAISIYFDDLNKHFNIFGYFENEWIAFDKEHNYTAFLIKRK
jgi:hypothetical protein